MCRAVFFFSFSKYFLLLSIILATFHLLLLLITCFTRRTTIGEETEVSKNYFHRVTFWVYLGTKQAGMARFSLFSGNNLPASPSEPSIIFKKQNFSALSIAGFLPRHHFFTFLVGRVYIYIHTHTRPDNGAANSTWPACVHVHRKEPLGRSVR